jgi:hypothetical protein
MRTWVFLRYAPGRKNDSLEAVNCIVSLLLLASAAIAQQSHMVTRTYDLNGRAVEGVRTVQTDGSRSQITRDLNGSTVPIHSVEERVVSDSGGMRVIEVVLRPYDSNGTARPVEKRRIEEQVQADGTIRTRTVITRGDINGSFHVAERSSTITRLSGDRTESTTTVERPTLNGGIDLYERREETIVKSGARTMENTTTSRKDSNGRLSEVAKKTREAVASNGGVNENVSEFEAASTGHMRLARQSSIRVEPNGSREVTVYLPTPEGKMALFQQQTTARSVEPGGTMETTFIRLADPNNPGRLGPARKAEEVICTGDCAKTKASTVAQVHQPANSK